MRGRPSISACGVAAAASLTRATTSSRTFVHSISRMSSLLSVVVVLVLLVVASNVVKD